MKSKNDIIILLGILGILSFLLLLNFWRIQAQKKKLIKENETLQKKIKLLEAEHMKFQLQPHTIKNIFAHLKIFADKLNQGMDRLSDTLDYILYNGNESLVSVEEEISFINHYIQLNDLFIDEIEAIQLDDAGVLKTAVFYQRRCIPHLITAHFIENAFKHGDQKHPEFLKIKLGLTSEYFQLKVVNKVKKKRKNKQGGIGLENMKKRLEHFMPEQYSIDQSQTENEFHSNLKIFFKK